MLIPVTMTCFGSYFIKNTPHQINVFFGYRTAMSMKNVETWTFAHHYIGRLWRTFGWVMTLLSFVFMLTLFSKETGDIAKTGAVLCYIQLAILIGTIVPTEVALKHSFDKNGNPTA
jgi:uncharacterized membrane protein